MAVEAGQMLGRYKLEAMVGSGAFGSVWLATDSWLSKKVALKIPHDQEQDFSKLLEEPKLLAAMDHPNIIKLFTVENAGGTMFMVMEFVEGTSLKERIRKGALGVDEVLGIARGMLEALAYAHRKGLVHRDLKPANVLMTGEGQVKITDFGTAHAIQAGEQTVVAGTLFYMPKEQLMGRVLPVSDLYSTAVMMFEMLTGRVPYSEENGSRLIQRIIAGGEPPDASALNPAVPAPVAKVIMRAMMPDYRARWKTAEEFLAALNAAAEGKEPQVPGGPPQPIPAYEAFSRKVPRLAETLNVTHRFEFQKAIGGRGKGKGQFLLPADIAVDQEGHVFVTDAIRCNIQIFDKAGEYVTTLGAEGGVMDGGLRFRNPSGIAVDREGLIYVTDTKNCRVVILTRSEDIVKSIGRPLVVMGIHAEEHGIVGFNYPRGLTLDEDGGLLYIADTGNNRLRLFTMGGMPVQAFGALGDRTGEFNAPLGIAVGAGGRLYVADSQNFRVQVFERDFRFVESIGRRGSGRGEFSHAPVDVMVTVNGELIVCDDTDRMHVFTEDGKYTGNIELPKSVSPTPKYFATALRESQELFAVDEHGCQVHWLTYREREK